MPNLVEIVNDGPTRDESLRELLSGFDRTRTQLCVNSGAPSTRSDRPHPLKESTEHATVALKRAIDHEPGDSLKCFLAEFLVLEFV